MPKFTLFRTKAKIRMAGLPTDVDVALQLLRKRNLNYQMLVAAIQACLREDEGGLLAFCEDYGVDPLDPIKRGDVLRHALEIAGEVTSG